MSDEKFMRRAIELAARTTDEVPVGAVVVLDGKVVGEDPWPGQIVNSGSAVRLVIGRRGPRRDTIPGGP